jgi:hypothetical protein
LLFVPDRLVDSELMPLCAVLIPLDVEVDSTATLLFVVDSPVDSEATPLCAVLMPLDAEVDNVARLLFVLDNPVDSEATPLCAVLIPLDVDVDSTATVLFVVDRPVDSELIPFEVDVDSEAMLLCVVLSPAKSSDPFTASVLVAVICPAATFVMVLSAPTAPTLTVLPGVVPANPLYVVLPIVALPVPTAAAVTLPLPKATSFALAATVFEPIATEEVPFVVAVVPMATAPVRLPAFAFKPICSHDAPPTIKPPGAKSCIWPAALLFPTLPRLMNAVPAAPLESS